MKHNPDDRSDNVEKIQYNIDHTIQNIELSEDTIQNTDDQEMKNALEEKNERRMEALRGMRKEIRDEAIHRDNHSS